MLKACVTVAFLLLLVTRGATAGPPDEPEKKTLMLTEEQELLKTLKKTAFEKHKRTIFSDSPHENKLKALEEIASLNYLQGMELLNTLYDNPIGENASEERLAIIRILTEAGCRGCGEILLKAVRNPEKDGKIRAAAIPIFARSGGSQAISLLRKLADDPVEKVSRLAWLELLKIHDLKAMRRVFKMLAGNEQDEKLAAISMVKDAHFTEAADEIARIASETVFSKGPGEKILKLKALATALDLGHKKSVTVALELVGVISKEQAEVLEVKSPVDLLIQYTKEDFGTDKKKWQQWLDSKAKATPLFSNYLDTTELRGIGNAVVEWTTDKKSGPLVKSSIVYLADSPVTRHIAKPDGSIRVYTKEELKLLNVNCIYINKASSNGNRAFVILQIDSRQTGVALQLQKKNSSWQVTGISEGDR